MSACEQCWGDAYPIARMTGRHQVEVYHELLEKRAHAQSDPRPMTVAEQLDAARSGEEFTQVIQNLFGVLEAARDEDES